jgi:hypothetical protein
MCVVTIDSASLSKEPFDSIPDHLASAENGIGQVLQLTSIPTRLGNPDRCVLVQRKKDRFAKIRDSAE